MSIFINRKLSITLVAIVNFLFVAGCAKEPSKPLVTTIPEIKTEPIEFVQLPSDYEIALRGLGSTYFYINPISNDYRRKIYVKKLIGIVNKDKYEFELNVVENEKVKKYIDYFTGRGREYYEVWLERSGNYIPIFEDILETWKIPKEIAYLSMIESGFNMKARSNKHAVGPWQFINSTGIRYNLKIDSWVDERMHLEKSTHAAASYLTDLYDIFQSWELALASYNCGEKRVYREVKKHNSYDYWVISQSLPKETREYIPKYFAALLIAKNPEKYGFKKPNFIREKDYQLVNIPPSKSLKDIANVCTIDYETLLDYNPSLIGLATPPGSYYQLRVPREYALHLESKSKEIASLEEIKYLSATKEKTEFTYYKVRKGDNLGYIAKKFGTSTGNIKSLNNINGSTIYPGQNLRISGNYKSSTPQSTQLKNSTVTNHKVRNGESLYVIAKKYNTSIDSIKSVNNLSSSNIVTGQTLKIHGSQTSSTLNYKVKNGDTLSQIAETYSVSVTDLKKWNKMSSSRLTAGKKLVIYR
ncbi:MAG: LysM peptidoglycan-binding domain-containing protein [Thermodesulfobacteriota bacterium]